MNMVVKGYSLYVNACFYEVYETLREANRMAWRYGKSNEVEIFPMWGIEVKIM